LAKKLDFSKSNADLVNLEIGPPQQNLELKQELECSHEKNKSTKPRKQDHKSMMD